MPIYDFVCESCDEVTEEIVSSEVVRLTCKKCGSTKERRPCAPHTLTEIVPSYPGCLANKAGYIHSHGPRPATKVQSGPGGCVNPK